MRAALTNIPRKIGSTKWKQCLRLMDGADFIGMNEILTRAQKKVLMAEAARMGYAGYGWQGPNPVLWDKAKYKFVAGGVYRLHGVGPKHRRWPGFNAARYQTLVALAPLDPKAPPTTLLCTHWVPRGKKVPAWWRNRQRKASIAKVGSVVKAQTRNGRNVVVMGDLNMNQNPSLPGVKWITGATIDKVGIAVAPRYHLGRYSSTRFKSPTDHGAGTRADFNLEAA